MTKSTQTLTVDQRDKKCGVTTRACGNSEPAFVVYEGSASADVVAHFFTQDKAQDYVDWQNGLLIRAETQRREFSERSSSLPGRAAGGHPRNGT